ncbi:GIY-YIG nuclease family protein [Sorangium sp. So ce385]|uniref:GIY-YIG nuclease family protein n=1 Tax=Sorangium sp. So ce385 TaxID=3133308 RepID=UPI003F5B4C46
MGTLMAREVYEKWGFGMAPPKPATQAARLREAQSVLAELEADSSNNVDPSFLEDLSGTKGLFNRVRRQDQWDWFTVAGQLGYPSTGLAGVIADEFGRLRRALRDGEHTEATEAHAGLRRLPTRRCLAVFLGRLQLADEPGAGWVYILSTRESPNLLKIGMTARSVEQRVKEINAATGIAIPFGVRHCWRVSDPAAAERLVHGCLVQHRLRADREFFRIDYFEARGKIHNELSAAGLELRTLNHLAALHDVR